MKVADSSEITLRLEELISRLLNNFAFYMNDFLSAKHELFEEKHDAEYNEHGNLRSCENPYSRSLADAEEAYQKTLNNVRRFVRAAAELATFSSFDVAKEAVAILSRQEPSKHFSIEKEKIDDLEYLCVLEGDRKVAVIDIDIEIGEDSLRNTFADEKTVNGKIYPLYSFISEEYRQIYEIYKSNIRNISPDDN